LTDFDRYRDRYRQSVEDSIAFVSRDLDLFNEVKADALVRLCQERLGPPGGLTALDAGCGAGLIDRLLAGRFAALSGVDVAPGMVATAAALNPSVSYQVYDGHKLPYADGGFRLVFAINVLHHVAPEARPAVARELARVTGKGGLVAVIEHNPVNPLTRRAVSRCPMDEGVTLLPRREVETLLAGAGLGCTGRRYLHFFPWRGAAYRALERALARLPLGAQYLVAARKSGGAVPMGERTPA